MRIVDVEPVIRDLTAMKTELGFDALLIDAMIEGLESQPVVRTDDTLRDQWFSIDDRLPEVFCPVIVCREKVKGEYVVEQGYKDVGDWWKVYGTRTKKVTHWMPLPDPPEEDKP